MKVVLISLVTSASSCEAFFELEVMALFIENFIPIDKKMHLTFKVTYKVSLKLA